MEHHGAFDSIGGFSFIKLVPIFALRMLPYAFASLSGAGIFRAKQKDFFSPKHSLCQALRRLPGLSHASKVQTFVAGVAHNIS